MAMVYIIITLFALAIICPFILPNKKVSDHEKDWD